MNLGTSPPKGAGRAPYGGPTLNVNGSASRDTITSLDSTIRRRRTAALRFEPLDDGHRDPFDRDARPDGPGTYGLAEAELRAHANDLALVEGWQMWEVAARLDVQPRARCARGGERAVA